jgi:hypothetical protein
MEENIDTSIGIPHTPISVVAGGVVVPPTPPPPISTMTVQKPTTMGSGIIPLTTLTIVPSIQNTYGTPFSYGMSGFDSSSVLTYSTLKTIGLGTRISNATLQGFVAGTTSSFNDIPYGGGHIPSLSPSLRGTFHQLIRLNTNSIFFSGGSHGP